MTAFLFWLGGIVGPKAARPVAIVGGVVLLIGLLAMGKCAYDRSVIRTHEDKQNAAVATKARPADAKAAASRETDNAKITADQQEITNALAPLPDVPLTPRQHARACAVLLRQAREAGRPKPSGC